MMYNNATDSCNAYDEENRESAPEKKKRHRHANRGISIRI